MKLSEPGVFPFFYSFSALWHSSFVIFHSQLSAFSSLSGVIKSYFKKMLLMGLSKSTPLVSYRDLKNLSSSLRIPCLDHPFQSYRWSWVLQFFSWWHCIFQGQGNILCSSRLFQTISLCSLKLHLWLFDHCYFTKLRCQSLSFKSDDRVAFAVFSL